MDNRCMPLIIPASKAAKSSSGVPKTARNFSTLDSQQRTLDADMLVIADTVRSIGIAGVMGGQNSEIKESTQMIVFESANFDGTSIRRTSRKLGMRTEASSRFEKGLDPENTTAAVNRACELLEMLDAGEVLDGIIDIYPQPVEKTDIKIRAGQNQPSAWDRYTGGRYARIS